MIKYLRKLIGRWKTDLALASSYLSTFMLFITMASSIYGMNPFDVQNILPQYEIFLIACFVSFPFIFKAVAKIIILSGMYAAEKDYATEIDPFTVDQLTPKEKNYFVPVNCDMAQNQIDLLNVLLAIMDSNMDKEEVKKMAQKNKDRLQKSINRYRNLLNNDI